MKSKALILILIAAVAAIVLLVVVPPSRVPVEPLLLSLDPGFRLFPTPRTFDGPGTVFRINGNAKYHVCQLDAAVQNAGNERPGHYQRKEKLTAGALINLIGGTARSMTAAGRETTIQVQISFEQATRYRTSDAVIHVAITNAIADGRLKFDDASQYFVIREVIAVRKISYLAKVVGSVAARQEFDATIRDGVKATVAVSGSSAHGESLQIDEEFDQPFNVCYLPDEILPGIAVGANSEIQLVRIDSSFPKWIEESAPELAQLAP